MNANLANIPRGNTCPGVNRSIIEYLISNDIDLNDKIVLDVPCGSGEFLDSINLMFPNARPIGVDIQPPLRFSHAFYVFDARGSTELLIQEKVDIVTCISGVMEFDNTLSFFRKITNVTSDDAVIFVTNDNVATVRDRILYLLFARFGQYKTLPEKRGSTWKVLHLADLERILSEAGIKVIDVRYVIGTWTAWLWLPLALPLYVAQFLYFLIGERSTKLSEKRRYFPFVSTIARHYLFVCEKVSNVADLEAGRPSPTK